MTDTGLWPVRPLVAPPGAPAIFPSRRVTASRSAAPAIGTFGLGSCCRGMEPTFSLVFGTLAVAAMLVIIVYIKPVH
jgi:hypothetical protein